jgi:peptidoglycan/LPS O-acetylase OafA/YrhL
MKRLDFPARPSLLPEQAHLPVIDEIKGIAILMVVWYHISAGFGVPNILHGEIGVDIFLIISGLVLVWRSANMPAGVFLRRRFWRIYPAYWLAYALFFYLGTTFFGGERSVTNVLLHLAGLHGFGPQRFFFDVNESFWFISILVGGYATFLLLRNRLHDFSLVAGVGGMVTALACAGYLAANHHPGVGHLVVRIPSFFTGLLLGQVVCGRPFTVKLNLWLVLAVGGAYYVIFTRGIPLGYAFPAFLFIVGWAYVRPWIRKSIFIDWLPALLAWVGVFSYEIFLLHQPLMRDYPRVFLARVLEIPSPSRSQLLAATWVAFVIVLIAAWAIHQLTDWLFRRPRATSPQIAPMRAGT